MPTPQKKIDFAISYAGEDFSHAKEVCRRLQQLGFDVFFGGEQPNLLAGIDGESLFEQLFFTASLVLVFISKDYKRKEWPRYEWDVIRARENSKRFIPIRVDDTRILGLPSNILYLDVREKSYDEIAEAAIKQLILYEKANKIHRPSEFELILNAFKNGSKGELSKAYQLVVDQRERTPLDDTEIPIADWNLSYTIIETEWCDFSKIKRLKVRVCVPEELAKDELIFNLKHCAASLFNELKPDALIVFAYSGKLCLSKQWGQFNAGRLIFAPHGKWEGAIDGLAYNLPTAEFDYSIKFPNRNQIHILSSKPKTDSIDTRNANVASFTKIQKIFKKGVPIHGINSVDQLQFLTEDIARFDIKASLTNIGLGPAFTIRGSVKLGQLPVPFKVIDGVNGQKYMLFLQGYLLSPWGDVVWQQRGFPRGGQWINVSGDTAKFILISAYAGKTKGYKAILIAIGTPILSKSTKVHALLGIKEITLEF